MRAVLIALAAMLIATACVSVLKDDERTWCSGHTQEVVAASYALGAPMTPADVLASSEADTQPPKYVRACRAAYEDR